MPWVLRAMRLERFVVVAHCEDHTEPRLGQTETRATRAAEQLACEGLRGLSPIALLGPVPGVT